MLPRQECCESAELCSRNAMTGLDLNFRVKQEEANSQTNAIFNLLAHPKSACI